MALKITDSNFEEYLKGDKPLVVDFWAEWCGPCKTLGPIIEDLAKDFEGKINVGKVDVDDNNDVCTRFGIRNIPTVLFFKNGELVDKQVGAVQKALLLEKMNNLL